MKTRAQHWLPAAILTLFLPLSLLGAAPIGLLVNTNDTLANVTAQRLWSSNFATLATNPAALSAGTLTLTNPLAAASGGTGATNAQQALGALGGQPTNATLTSISVLSLVTGDVLIVSNSVPARLAHPGANGKVLTSTNSPSGGLAWLDPPSSGGSGTVSSVGMTSSVSGLQFTSVPITTSGTASLTGVVAVASGGTGQTNAAAALGALGGQPTNSVLTTVGSLSGGTSTNFLAGDGSYKQVTTNMIPGLNAALAATQQSNYVDVSVGTLTLTNALGITSGGTGQTNAAAALGALGGQPTNSVLTTVGSLSGGTSTNFLAGDGTYKQVTTNMIPGLNAALAAGGSGGSTNASQVKVNASAYLPTAIFTNSPTLTFSTNSDGTIYGTVVSSGGSSAVVTNYAEQNLPIALWYQPATNLLWQTTNYHPIALTVDTNSVALRADAFVPSWLSALPASAQLITHWKASVGNSNSQSVVIGARLMRGGVDDSDSFGAQVLATNVVTAAGTWFRVTNSISDFDSLAAGDAFTLDVQALRSSAGFTATNSFQFRGGELVWSTTGQAYGATNYVALSVGTLTVTNLIAPTMSIGTLTVTTNTVLTNSTLNGTTTLSSSTNTGTAGFAGAVTVGSTNIALELSLKANTNAPTFIGTATFNSTTNTGTIGVAGAVTIGTTNVALALSQKADTNAPTFIGTATFASITNTGTIGTAGAVTIGTTNIALELSKKANTNAPTFLGLAVFASTTNSSTAGYAGAVTIGTTNVALELSKKANTNAPTFLGTATFNSTTNTGTAGYAGAVTIGTTNVAAALALKAPLTSAALVTPTLTNATYNGSMALQLVERQPHATVTNYVADPTVSGYQIIYATNLVTKFLHLTNAAAGLQTTFLVIAGTNTTVSVELPATIWASNTNKVSIALGQILPISIMCYGSDNTNVVASMGQPLIR